MNTRQILVIVIIVAALISVVLVSFLVTTTNVLLLLLLPANTKTTTTIFQEPNNNNKIQDSRGEKQHFFQHPKETLYLIQLPYPVNICKLRHCNGNRLVLASLFRSGVCSHYLITYHDG